MNQAAAVRNPRSAGKMPVLRIALALLFTLLLTSASRGADLTALRPLPVLDGGRVKPIDTAARESISRITGREAFQGWDALDLCLAITREPAAWENQPLLHVPFLELRALLALPEGTQFASPQQVRSNPKLRELLAAATEKQRLAEHRAEDPDINRLETAALELQRRLDEYDLLATDRRFAIVPLSADRWRTPDELTSNPATIPLHTAWLSALKDPNTAPALEREIQAFNAADYPNTAKLASEVAYHRLHPFRYAWITYLVSLAVLTLSLLVKNRWPYRIGFGLLLAGIVISVGSFAWRCSITGWAPVTNIYETVIWVAMVGSIVAAGIEWSNRTTTPAIAGALAAVVAGLIADVMPPEFGGAIRTLAPVLQSNFWLSIHVLTIVSSYAGFLVALILGNIVLTQFAFRPASPSISTNLKHLYRAIQVGVLLVGAGTILGGLWADVSWGRFWGWDPKEVWALIIFLVYLALLHGRYAGWVGPFALAAGAVLCFLTVLMSWYGVNFILGAGLHTYGFATGGLPYVAAFALAQLAYLALCTSIARRRRATSPQRTSGFEVISNVA
jgi:ABC-type transport system involved in cytochrome c biogenesis permease subunit